MDIFKTLKALSDAGITLQKAEELFTLYKKMRRTDAKLRIAGDLYARFCARGPTPNPDEADALADRAKQCAEILVAKFNAEGV